GTAGHVAVAEDLEVVAVGRQGPEGTEVRLTVRDRRVGGAEVGRNYFPESAVDIPAGIAARALGVVQHRALLDVVQDVEMHRPDATAVGPNRPLGGRQGQVGAMELVTGQGNLLEVVQRLRAGRGATDHLDGRYQQADQDGDDGDDHEQFDESNPAAAV